jgi:hypothetical protein
MGAERYRGARAFSFFLVAALAGCVVTGCAASGSVDEAPGDGDASSGNGGDTADAAKPATDAAPDTAKPPIDPNKDAAAPPDAAGDDASTATDANDGAPPTDAGPMFPPGHTCQADGECASKLCKPVLLGTSVCVTPCTSTADCNGIPTSFCEPISAGSTDGYCIPRSPSHCLSCQADSDCGSLSEACFVGPNDNAKACHVDCAIAGAAACPNDYGCNSVTVNGTVRMMCTPTVGTCLDAVGGYCDRVAIPQSCSRTNSAGACVGQRACLAGSNRYGACAAQAPQCKATCSAQDPAGCTTTYCPSATAGPDNCGTCGNVCPGLNKPNANVTCSAPTCSFSCQGETYDPNNQPNDGCEAADSPTGNHTSQTPTYVGNFPCTDGQSQQNFGGKIPSDQRAHQSPTIIGLNGTTGGAPDFFRLHADGGACQNDLNMYLQVSGSVSPTCYKMTVITNVHTQTCTTDGNGFCKIENGASSYGDNTDINVTVEKTCSSSTRDNPTYTVTGHL